MRFGYQRERFQESFWGAVVVLWASWAVLGCDSSPTEPPGSSTEGPYDVYVGRLAAGLDMGVNTSGGLTDWITEGDGFMEMAYPAGQSWGAVFITMGPPKDPPRPGMNMSAYDRIYVELCGARGGESIWVGIKDNTDPDNGKEAQVRVYNITTEWEAYEFPLSQFYTADLDSVYVLLEFVFSGGARTISFKDVRYLR